MLPSEDAREDGEVVTLGEPLEKAIGSKPAFAQDQTVTGLALKEFLKVIDDFLVSCRACALLNHAVREQPVVVPAATILPVLNLFARRLVAGECFTVA